MTKNTLKINDIVICGLFVALIAIGAFIKVPVPFVPFTLQTLFTTLAGLFLGGKKGFLCVFVYMILGLIGLPIFASGGGPGYIFQPRLRQRLPTGSSRAPSDQPGKRSACPVRSGIPVLRTTGISVRPPGKRPFPPEYNG